MSRYKKKRSGQGGGSSVIPAVCLTLFIFSAAVLLALNAGWLYALDIRWLHIEQGSGMSLETIKRNYHALIAYNQIWYRGELALTLPMSEGGRIHFAECKRIFDLIWIVGIVTGLGSILLYMKRRKADRKRALRLTGILTLVIPIVLGALVAVSWKTFFVRFHQIVFRNDYWLFDPTTDPVILMLPEGFFLHSALLILLLIVFGAVICLLLSRGKKKRRYR